MSRARIYVGGLSAHTTARDLERFFQCCGKINEVLLKKGFGFVQFEDQRDADDALHELNGKRLLGKRITIEMAHGKPRGRDRFAKREVHTRHRLIVTNLSARVNWQALKHHMRQAGEVTYADAHKLRVNEGVVEFASYADMKYALEKLDGTEMYDRRICLIEDKRSEESRFAFYRRRSSSRTRSRRLSSHSGSRSRSRSRPRGARSRSISRARSPPQDDSGRRMSMSLNHSEPRPSAKCISESRIRPRSRSRNEDRIYKPLRNTS